MEIISLANRTTDGIQALALTLEDDNGDVRTIVVSKDSSRYQRTLDLATQTLTTDDEEVREKAFDAISAMHDISRRVATALQHIASETSGTFAVSRSGVLYEGSLLPREISDHILRILSEAGQDSKGFESWGAFAKFVENLYTNVDEHVRDQLFSWIAAMSRISGGFTLTRDGHIIGYKGVTRNGEGIPVSRRSGHAMVLSTDPETGEEVLSDYKNQQIPNVVGTDVLMPRNEVQNDPSVGCSAGLHVATIEYARGFASGVLLTVKVNPKDIVSVPTECDAQKMRVSRYSVLSAVQERIESTFYSEDVDEDEDEDDICDCEDCVAADGENDDWDY